MGLSFNTSLSGLIASQQNMQVAQNNISNANTEGYARERLELEENATVAGSGVNGQIGLGVDATSVSRIKDDMLISQTRSETSQVGYYDGMQTTLGNVEAIFGEGQSGSISDLMSKFFDSWDELNKFPDQDSYRQSLIGQAQSFSNRLNTIMGQLDTEKTTVDTQIDTKITAINDLTQKIADINNKIGHSTNQNPNTLLDQRDSYIDQLSQYTDVQVTNDVKNPNIVNIESGGATLVAGNTANALTKMVDSTTNQMTLVANGMVMNPNSGSLKSDFDLKNTYIPQYEDKVNELTSTLITQINAAHSTGYGLDNSTGNNFFLGTDARTIQVNPDLVANPEKIAVSSTPNTPANSDQGQAISGIRDLTLFNGNTVTPENFYNAFIVNVGTDVSSAEDNLTVHQNVLNGVTQSKESIQGVNIDEEMTNLMQSQQMYQANAKAIKATDDTLSVLMQMTQ